MSEYKRDNAEVLGAELESRMSSGLLNTDFGLCNTCEELFANEDMYNNVFALCTNRDLRIRLQDGRSIKRCTGYRKRGALSIWDMKDIAVSISLDKRPGFMSEDLMKDT